MPLPVAEVTVAPEFVETVPVQAGFVSVGAVVLQVKLIGVAFALWENSGKTRATATKGRRRQAKIFIDGLSLYVFLRKSIQPGPYMDNCSNLEKEIFLSRTLATA